MKKALISGLLLLALCAWFSSVIAQPITLIAGNGASTGGDGGPATAAGIERPEAMVFDSHGNLWFTDPTADLIRKITPSGMITTIVGSAGAGFFGDGGPASAAKINRPSGISIDTLDNIYFADQSNHRIRKIDATTGIITTIAGIGIAGYNGDDIPATAAQLKFPYSVNVDKYGNLYISDNANRRLRKIDAAGIITTIAGNGGLGSSGDGGPATAAECAPFNVAFDAAGNIYISDRSAYTIRKINTEGIISTVAGVSGSYIYNGNGLPATSTHIEPGYIAVDKAGNIYIPDGFNSRIRRVNTFGMMQTIAGIGLGGDSGDDGEATDAHIGAPSAVILDTCGNLFLSQFNGARIRKITFNATCPGETKIGALSAADEIVHLYPDPVSTTFSLTFTEKINNISITNSIGQIVYLQQSIHKEHVQINIAHLPQGVYTIKINGANARCLIKQ